MTLTAQVHQLLENTRPLPLVMAGDPVLRRPARPYDGELDQETLTALVAAMRETMEAAPGVGLAAPQIGLSLQIAVLQDTAAVPAEIVRVRERPPLPFRVLVNPTYTAVGEQTALFYEGCLSVHGYHAAVRRPRTVALTGYDESGQVIDETVTGWPARIVAHETDHLAGVLYLDRAELRSLTTNENYLARWAEPEPLSAAAGLGFGAAAPSAP